MLRFESSGAPRGGRGLFRNIGGVLVAVVALGAGACADSSIQQSQCDADDDCNPGYHCSSGACVAGERDGAVYEDAFHIPPSDALPPDASICAEAQFTLSETEEHFDVPAGARFMHVKAWGSGGNGEGQCTFDDGGIGGYSEAVFAVIPGDPLVVIVGAPGSASHQGADVVRFGFGSSGGGGLSGVFRGPDMLDETSADRALIIAGGAGGAGVGPSGDRCRPGGTGNHPDAGIQTTMMGGIGLDDGVNGGGGGCNGGDGGPVRESGKGGTGCVSEADKAPDSDHVILHVEPGAGAPPKTDDEDYNGTAGRTETGGLVVIHFVCTVPPVM